MGHHIHAFLFRGPVDEAALAPWPAMKLCSLPQGVSALALTEEVLDLELPPAVGEVPTRFVYLDAALLAIARRCAAGGRFAYVETNYFGGVGDQEAALWQGEVLLTPADGLDPTINDVLGAMGVTAGDEVDAFAAIGLPVMRGDDDFAVGLDRRLFDIYGRRMIGRYVGAAGALELVRDDDHLAVRTATGPSRWRFISEARYVLDGVEYRRRFERSGTPGLVRSDGAIFHYNDGPSLVHDPTRVEWADHVGVYTAADGRVVRVELSKKQLYLDGVRLLPIERPNAGSLPYGERVEKDRLRSVKGMLVEFERVRRGRTVGLRFGRVRLRRVSSANGA